MSGTTPVSGSPSGEILEAQIERAEKTLDRLLEWIRAVDSKTPVVMAIDTAMLGVLAALAPSPDQFCAATWFQIAFGSLALIISLGLCAMATFPQTKGPEGSLIFFGGIAARSPESFAQAMREQTSALYLDDILRQCHRNAEIAASKYARVRRALFWLVGGIVPWLGTLYLLSRGS